MTDGSDAVFVELDAWQIESRPSEAVVAPATSAPALLPFGRQSWESFEQSVLRVAERVDGLHDVRVYGTRGQTQHGIDIYGNDDEGRRVGYQAKRYENFTVADFDAAVQSFAVGKRPVDAGKLVVCVASLADRTEFAEKLEELRKKYDFEIELYDQRRLSELLKGRPDLVRRIFGRVWTEAFCDEAGWEIPVVSEAQALADSILRGPLRALALEDQLVKVDEAAASDPARAATTLAEVVERLITEGFRALTHEMRCRQAELLVSAGAVGEAGDVLSRLAWEQVDSGYAYWNREALGRLRALVQQHDLPMQATFVSALSDIEEWFAQPDPSLSRLVERVLALHEAGHPLADAVGVWVAETAVATGEPDGSRLVPCLQRLALRIPTTTGASELATRAACSVGDLNGDWSDVVRLARRGELGPRLATLVHERVGRYRFYSGEPQNAEDAFREAVSQGLMARLPGEAAHALRSIIRVKTSFGPLNDAPNELQSLAHSLEATGAETLLGRRRDAHDAGVAALAQEKLPEALRWLRIAHRESVICGDLFGELSATKRLAEVLFRAGELHASLVHAIRGGDEKDARRCVVGAGSFVDVRDFMGEGPYWVRSAALATSAEEADLVPDELIPEMADVALAACVEPPRTVFAPHVWLAGWRLVARIAMRCDEARAARALELLEDHIERTPNTYRHNDDDHVATVAAICATHAALADRASGHLARIVAQGDHFAEQARLAIVRNLDSLPNELATRLTGLAESGSEIAGEILFDFGTTLPAMRERAGVRVRAQMAREAPAGGQLSFGLGLAQTAVSVRALTSDEQLEFAVYCMVMAEDSRWPESNRSEALESIGILAKELPPEIRHDLFARCLNLVRFPKVSAFDRSLLGGLHPLSSFRVDLDFGSSPRQALQSAALLALGEEETRAASDLAMPLEMGSERDVYAASHALARLPAEHLEIDLQILASHQQTWARQAAAAIFVNRPSLAPHLGDALANDPDPRVRSTLSGGLSVLRASDAVLAERLATTLAGDARWSVRRAALAAIAR